MTNQPRINSCFLSTESRSLVILFISAFLFSVMGCFVKLSGDAGIPSTELVFSRATFQITIVIICMCLFRAETEFQGEQNSRIIFHPFGGKPNVIRVVMARGIVGGFGFLMYFYSITVLPLGDAITLFSLYPVHTIILARFILNEKIHLSHVFCVLCSAVGATLIAGPTIFQYHVSGESYSILGYFTSIFGSVCSALVMILVRKAGKVGAHTLQLLFSWCVFGILLSFVFGFFVPSFYEAWIFFLSFPKKAYYYVLGLCSFGTAAHFCLNYAGKKAPAGLGSIVRASDIMWAYMWQVLVFQQTPSFWTICGVICIFISLLVIAIQRVYDEKNLSKERKDTLPINISKAIDNYGATHTPK